MLEQTAYLRIREGAFTYLLSANQVVSIERRNSDDPAPADDRSTTVAWLRSGGERVPVVRLGALFDTPVAEWEYAIVLSDGTRRVGVAAEHIHRIHEADIPVIQPFNPPGARVPGGAVINGLCPHTDPEYLVLDQARLQQCLSRVADPAPGDSQ